jgi:hypothetical protein
MENKLKKIEVEMSEIWAHTKPKIHKNKKKYDRKKINKKSFLDYNI